MIWLIVASVVLPQLPRAPATAKDPIAHCYRELGIVEQPSTAEAFVRLMDSKEMRRCMTWAPTDHDAHVSVPSAVERLMQTPPKQ